VLLMKMPPVAVVASRELTLVVSGSVVVPMPLVAVTARDVR